MFIFGPVPSRRLGRSIGINNIPPKICTYSCIYCQVGRSTKMFSDRKDFKNTDAIIKELYTKLEKLDKKNEKIDYLTLVSDGEPTLDKNLCKLIKELKKTGIKTALISNSTLLTRKDVIEDILLVDWLSLKVDTINEKLWTKIDRPLKTLILEDILDSVKDISNLHNGITVSETMLVKDLNDRSSDLKDTADFLSECDFETSYISVPTRPPAEKWCLPPEESNINMAYQIFKNHLENVELNISYEGNDFSSTGDVEKDLLSITKVHPMKEEAIMEYLRKNNMTEKNLERIIKTGLLKKTCFNNENFYIFSNKKL